MKKLFLILALMTFSTIDVLAQTQCVRLREIDGSPDVNCVRQINVTNGTLSCSGNVCTLSTGGGGGSGTVTSVSFTGGLISVADPTGAAALTVAGTSGGIPYFSGTTTWASSTALAANAIVIGGGAGAAPATTTTGTGVLTALGVNVGSAGAFVVFNGAGGTPSSLTLTNATGLPPTTGISGWPANASGVLTNNGSGTLSWGAGGSGITIDSTVITGGTVQRILFENASNQVSESSQFTFTPSPTTGSGLAVAASTVTSGNLVSIAASGTAAASNTKTALSVATSGANGTASQKTFGASFGNTSTGTSSTNVGATFAASGGSSDNFAIEVTAGQSIFPDGTTSLPSISFGAQSTTGFSRGTSTIQISLAGVERGRFTGSGLSLGTNDVLFGSAVGTNDLALTRKTTSILRISNASTGAGGLIIGNSTAVGNAGSLNVVSAVTTGTGTTAGIQGLFDSLTTGNGADISSTSVTSGTLLSLASTSTAGATGMEALNIAVSGANGTNGVTMTGGRISVTNTNATSGTNVALELTASGATTANTALNVTAGQSIFTAGTVALPGVAFTGGVYGWFLSGGTSIHASLNGGAIGIGLFNGGVSIPAASQYWFGSTAATTGAADAGFVRVAAATIRATNASTGAGNLILGTSAGAIGTSGAGVLAFTLSTAPSTSPTDTVQLYSNDAAAGDHNTYWRNEAGEVTRATGLAARNSSSFAKTSDTTLATITGLSRNVEAGRTYAFTAVMQTTAAATGGIKFAVSGTATATAISYEGILQDATVTVAQTRATALDTTVCASTTSTAGTCTIRGVIQVNAAGTFLIQFAQNASDGGASTVLANQYFQLIPIS